MNTATESGISTGLKSNNSTSTQDIEPGTASNSVLFNVITLTLHLLLLTKRLRFIRIAEYSVNRSSVHTICRSVSYGSKLPEVQCKRRPNYHPATRDGCYDGHDDNQRKSVTNDAVIDSHCGDDVNK